MEFTLKEIINRLPLKFSTGDSDILKNLMLKNENEFLRFRGKDQFDKKVKALYPEINITDLYHDYLFALKKAERVKFLCGWYKNHGELLLEFRFEESMGNDGSFLGSEFEVLNGVVLNAKDKFWNKYLPPNFPEDASCVRYLSLHTYKSRETTAPENLPESNFEFDLYGLFISHIKPLERPKTETGSGTEWLLDWGVDIKEIAFEAALEKFQENGTVATDEDKAVIRKMIDDNLIL